MPWALTGDTYAQQFARVTGSNYGDNLSLSNHADRVYGAGGNDYIWSGAGNDSIWGGLGNDTINAGSGDDLILGQQGSDRIDGGDGYDTLLFSGNRADYQLNIVDGAYQITHLLPDGQDGIDTFANIEALRFADQTVLVDEFQFV